MWQGSFLELQDYNNFGKYSDLLWTLQVLHGHVVGSGGPALPSALCRSLEPSSGPTSWASPSAASFLLQWDHAVQLYPRAQWEGRPLGRDGQQALRGEEPALRKAASCVREGQSLQSSRGGLGTGCCP